VNATSTQNEVIQLWPQGAPGSEDWNQVEEEFVLPDGVKAIRNVTQPTLTVYPADPAKANGTAVIVCPGGAYFILAIDKEGTDVAHWLAARGVTAFVLRYRLLPTGDHLGPEMEATMSDHEKFSRLMQWLEPFNLADGQQAMRLVRENAAKWGIAPDRIGMMGFSAGAGFTVNAVLHNSPDCRPDFAAPIYAAVFAPLTAPADAPPLFLLCANDDPMARDANQYLYAAWNAANRPVEMHVYSKGGHGFGMTTQGLPTDGWIERFWEWMVEEGLVGGE
jgi:acetyl esterase/lipase